MATEQTNEEYIAELKEWRANIVAAPKEPTTASAFGGMPNNSGANRIDRMGGRAQLLKELETVEAKITEAEQKEDSIYFGESRAIT